ncbi:MAG: hypothetical protein ABSB24_02865 [Gaiellaceae bacterium]|jgi:hypothetical protein
MALTNPPSGNPSAAFLAGQAHGRALALRNHMAGQPLVNPIGARQIAAAGVKKVAAPKPATAATPAVPLTLNQILAQARAAAAADTQATVTGIKQQQTLLDTQAQQRAGQITQASQAAANYLQGLGDMTGASYNNAAQVLAGLAQGYSGQTGADAQSAAAQVQANLAGLGAPSGSLKTATGQTSQPAALANVLYGLGGAIPASALVTGGQAQAAAQRGLPASMLGYGQQQAEGAVAAGQTAAANLTPQILDALSKQPALAQQYLASIQSQLTAQQNASLQSALAASLVGSRTAAATTAAAKIPILKQNANTAATRAAQTYALGQQRITASQAARATATTKAAAAIGRPNASLSGKRGYIVDSNGQAILGPNGQKQLLPGYTVNAKGRVVKAPTPPKPLTRAQTAKYRGQAITGASNALTAGFSYSAALQAAREEGIPDSISVPQLNLTYKVGAPASQTVDLMTQHGITPSGPPATLKQQALNAALFPSPLAGLLGRRK